MRARVARLVHARFVHARLVHARLVHARLVHARFVHARFVHARFVHARFVHARLVHARLGKFCFQSFRADFFVFSGDNLICKQCVALLAPADCPPFFESGRARR
ncbi:MAG: pentapeptide repeat-containing protein [Mycobacteriaceae bacterium]|nr:pentapeptide repeat-containing protein [Mycobacteriaceae bacterium]